MARQIIVEIIGDASGFSKATDGAITTSQSLTDKLKGVGKGMVIGAGIASFNLLKDAVGLAIGKLGEIHQMYKDQQVSEVLLGQALKNNIPNWNGGTAGAVRYAEAQSRLGFTSRDVQDSLAQLVGVTHDLTEAEDLNQLAMDLARSKGIDLAAATDIITKAHEGNGRALKALGIDIGDATTATELLDAVTANVTTTAEAFAATSEGRSQVAQTKIQAALVRVGEVMDKIAQVLIPILADAMEWIFDVAKKVFPYIEGTVRALAPVFGAIGAVAGAVFKDIGDAIGVLIFVGKAWYTAWSLIIGGLITAFRGIASVVSTVFSSVTGIVRGAINGVIAIINGMIGAINAIQVHIHVGPVNIDWNGLRIGKLHYLHAGGIVPGAPGSDQLALLQAGERVIPANAAGSSGVTVNFYGPVFGDEQFIDDFTRKIAMRLLTAP